MSSFLRTMGRVAPRISSMSTTAMMRAVAANCGIINFDTTASAMETAAPRPNLGLSAPVSSQFFETLAINLDANDPGA